jgi:queuine tRNA-ribosyltransferase
MKNFFRILARDSNSFARCGILELPHGNVQTPVFMPVGTQATVKGILPEQLEELGSEIILSNAYHLYLRPGTKVIYEAGGLHRFMNWKKPILTDSGGFQVFSLSPLRKVTEEGVEFRSHLDGSLHQFTPEKVVEIQRVLNSDIIMPLDECLPYPCDYSFAKASLLRTQRWLERSLAVERNPGQVLFPILQGSVFHDLRKEAAQRALELNPPGLAIGGLSIGEPKPLMLEVLEALVPHLPEEKPRYFMGLGTPEDLLEAVEHGVDMFDCVFPTRAGRTGLAFTSMGRLVIRNAPFRSDHTTLDPQCTCYTCTHYSRAYLHHLIHANELLAPILLSYHNLAFLIRLMQDVRQAIQSGNFVKFKQTFLERAFSKI